MDVVMASMFLGVVTDLTDGWARTRLLFRC